METRPVPAPQWRLALAAEAARYLGAVSILVVGAIHAQQYYYAYFYYVVPTRIGTLFLLSFIGAGVVGVALFAPVRLLGRRLGDLILVLAALGGISIACRNVLVSEYTPLFGFMESGYRLAIVLTLVFDVLSTAFLGFFVLVVGTQVVRSIAGLIPTCSRLRAHRPRLTPAIPPSALSDSLPGGAAATSRRRRTAASARVTPAPANPTGVARLPPEVRPNSLRSPRRC